MGKNWPSFGIEYQIPVLWVILLEPYSETLIMPGKIQPFGWSPDAKFVYAMRGGSEMIKVQAAPPNQLSSVAALPGNADGDDATVSLDGRQILVSVQEEKSDVWLLENFDSAAQARGPQ
jgi:hypothetical protein